MWRLCLRHLIRRQERSYRLVMHRFLQLGSCILLLLAANVSRVAAADTTSSSLVFVLYHCISNRRVWDRLCDEVRSKFASPNDITGQTTATMTYLDAVIQEGIPLPLQFSKMTKYQGTRLRPAAPANLIRDTPPEGMVIAGHFIPGKVRLPCTQSLTLRPR